MPNYTKTLSYATKIKKNVENKQELGESTKWAYYIAKQIIKPETSVGQIQIKNPSKPSGTYVSRQVFKSTYISLAKKLIEYVEKNNQMPNYISYESKTGNTIKLEPNVYTDMFSRILVYYNTHKLYPKYANVNSKAFKEETETSNGVYDYFVEKTGKKYKYIDDFLEYIRVNYNYEFYFDDQKSNKEVIDSEAGNCVDLLHLAVNIAEAMGYEWKCIHTQCRQSGTGHVYGKFRKGGDWFSRDPACIADESRICIWCDVDNGGGYQLAVNPSWWLANLHK